VQIYFIRTKFEFICQVNSIKFELVRTMQITWNLSSMFLTFEHFGLCIFLNLMANVTILYEHYFSEALDLYNHSRRSSP